MNPWLAFFLGFFIGSVWCGLCWLRYVFGGVGDSSA